MIAKYVLAPRIKFREERGTHTLISYYAGKEGPIRLRNALSLVLSAMWDTVLFFLLIACGIPSFYLSPWLGLFCKHYFKMFLNFFFFYYTFLECSWLSLKSGLDSVFVCLRLHLSAHSFFIFYFKPQVLTFLSWTAHPCTIYG